MEEEKKQPFLQVKNIKKRFGRVEALRGADLTAYTGEILAIVGDNGVPDGQVNPSGMEQPQWKRLCSRFIGG